MYTQFETYRGVIYPWMIDHVGHMNVQFYTARFDEATWQFLAQLGLTPTFLKRNHRSAVAVDQRTQYKRELVAGSLVHITTELERPRPERRPAIMMMVSSCSTTPASRSVFSPIISISFVAQGIS